MPALTLSNSTNVRSPLLGFVLQRAELAVVSALAPDRAVEIAAKLFATPPRFEHTPRERELLSTGERYGVATRHRSEEHTSELQSRLHLVCRLLLEKKKI